MVKPWIPRERPVSFPFRWRRSTFWRNLRYAWHDITGGIANLVRWAPVVWRDRWFDSAYAFDLLEFKLRMMADRFEEFDHHVGADRDARNMRICAELCRRISSDRYLLAPRYFKRDLSRTRSRIILEARQRDLDYLSTLLRKHLLGWWS